ncbi:MAG: helix-turn-helix transcriptional regulator [Chloroflexaceae bacterium]|nr:helix-turn-helix transcriptional regulator [Chloroflexaceae bacterium]
MGQIRWRVKERAEAKGLTIFHLAAQAEIAYNTASGLWHGRALRVNRVTLARICKA